MTTPKKSTQTKNSVTHSKTHAISSSKAKKTATKSSHSTSNLKSKVQSSLKSSLQAKKGAKKVVTKTPAAKSNSTVSSSISRNKTKSLKQDSIVSQKTDKKEIINLAKNTKDSTLANPKITKATRIIQVGQGSARQSTKPQSFVPTFKRVREVSQGAVKQSIMKHIEPSEQTKQIVLNARKRLTTSTSLKKRHKATPIVFTLEDVRKILKEQRNLAHESSKKSNGTAGVELGLKKSKPSTKNTAAIPAAIEKIDSQPTRSLGAASILDILGFNPKEKETKIRSFTDVSDRIPKKLMKYYDLLVQLRKHVLYELDLHTAQTLKRSSKDDTGDISGYGQHLADSGTDTFDRDFALSLVSTEQEALNEIEDAIQRMLDGSYGICEITGEKISPDRLDAVPFTRFSLEGQIQFEKTHKRPLQRGGVFSETTVAEATHFVDEDV